MDRAEALDTLRLDESADGRTIESAYWNLVRRAQERASGDVSATEDVERLNEAYGTLVPHGRRLAVLRANSDEPGTGVPILDGFADWISNEALRTRLRWPNRNPEIALIGGGAAVLMVLALGAGASLLSTFIAAGVVFVGVWSPWRRVE